MVTAARPSILTLAEVGSEAGLENLRDEWNGLVAKLELPSPFQSWEWHRSWWRHFARPRLDRMRVLLFRRDGQLVGIAPFRERSLLGVLELRPFGWRDRLTEHAVLLFPAAERAGLLEELWVWLAGRPWTSVGLPQLSGLEALPVPARRFVVGAEDIVFEHLVLPDTWGELEQGLGRSMRGNLRYYPRLLERAGLVHALKIARSPSEVAAALPLLWDLHAARAAAPTRIRHLDYLKPVRRRAFMLEVAPVLAARGEAAIGMLTVDGKVVAAQLWFEAGRAMFLYYSGYDPAWARYSVGMLTTAEILKDALARGVRRVEFLRGANQFKSRWGTQARAETDFVLGRRRRLVAAQEAYARGRKRMRRKLVRWRTKLERLHVEESPPQN